MRSIQKRFPVAAPFQSQIHSEGADCFVLRRFAQVAGFFKHAYIEGDPEIVIRKTAARVGHDAPGVRATLREKLVLLLIGAQAANYLNGDAMLGRFLHQSPRLRCTCSNNAAIAFSLRSSTRSRVPARTAAGTAGDVFRGGLFRDKSDCKLHSTSPARPYHPPPLRAPSAPR